MKYTVVISKAGVTYKICKIWFGSDGSYYVTVPYHNARKAVLLKQTLNYDISAPTHPDHMYYTEVADALEVGSSDDARIKLSHHPDGFIQFSGQGLISGRREDGSPKGIGIDSWPLEVGCRGPAFSIGIHGIEEFEIADGNEKSICALNYDDLTVLEGSRDMIIEGHYFPVLWRRFVRKRFDGVKTIPIVHPSGVLLELPVLLPDDECPMGGFIGLDFFGSLKRTPEDESGYSIGSSTGNGRQNEKGERLGDGLFCIYPRPDDLPIRRSLDYQKPVPTNPEPTS